jgi:hypothetical protein
MGLFIASPPITPAAWFISVGSHAGAILTPADEADSWIWAADAAVEVFGQRQSILWGRSGISRAYFFFCDYIFVHGSAPFSEKQKRRCLFCKDSALSFFHLFSCVVHGERPE